MFDDFMGPQEDPNEWLKRRYQQTTPDFRAPADVQEPFLQGLRTPAEPLPFSAPKAVEPLKAFPGVIPPRPQGRQEELGPTEGTPVPASGMFPSLSKTDQLQGPPETWNPIVYGPSGSTQEFWTKGPEGAWKQDRRVVTPFSGEAQTTAGNPNASAFQFTSSPGTVTKTGTGPKHGSAEWAQNAFQAAYEKYAYDPDLNGPANPDSPRAKRALELARLGLAPYQQEVENQGWIERAAAAHRNETSPQALKAKAYSSVFGPSLAQGMSPQEAHAAAFAASQSFNPSAEAPPAPPTAMGKRDFFGQNLDVLPTNFRYQGPGDKMASSGTAQVFGQPQAESLIQRMLLLPPEEQKTQLQKLMGSNVGPQIADTLAARFGSAYAGTLPADMPRDVGTVMGLAPGVEVKNMAPSFTSRLGREAPFGGTADPRYKLNRIVSKETGREVPLDPRLMGDTEKTKKIMDTEAKFMEMFWPYFAPKR